MEMNVSIWPRKHDLFGVGISRTTYAEAEDLVIGAAKRRQSAVVTHFTVHGVVTAVEDAEYRHRINSFDIVAPDGQPVRWAVNRFYGVGLTDRVYGPELMLRLCRRAAKEGVGVYLYGSRPDVVEELKRSLEGRCSGLRIVGWESPPFRALSDQERREAVRRINDSGAGLVFVGLGLPKQDHFAYEIRGEIHAVQMCVGAAFELHAGIKKMAPRWMQRAGLEWLFRLVQEPKRLWRRYLIANTEFVLLVLRRMALGR